MIEYGVMVFLATAPLCGLIAFYEWLHREDDAD